MIVTIHEMSAKIVCASNDDEKRKSIINAVDISVFIQRLAKS